MSADLFKSETEFLKLLIGLNTGIIAGFFYAQERLVHSRFTAGLYAGALLNFTMSLAVCLYAARVLIRVEHAGGSTLRTSHGEKLYETSDLWKLMTHYPNLWIFSAG
jgi:hypothetical protein